MPLPRKGKATVLSSRNWTFFSHKEELNFEHMHFNRRNQLDGKSAEQYITALYGLVKTCEYGGLCDEMLRDRIVVGIRDAAMSE